MFCEPKEISSWWSVWGKDALTITSGLIGVVLGWGLTKLSERGKLKFIINDTRITVSISDSMKFLSQVRSDERGTHLRISSHLTVYNSSSKLISLLDFKYKLLLTNGENHDFAIIDLNENKIDNHINFLPTQAQTLKLKIEVKVHQGIMYDEIETVYLQFKNVKDIITSLKLPK